MVSVHHQSTDHALIDAHRKGHRFSMTTTRTGLRRVCRRHFDDLSRSFFRFRDKACDKGRPGDVTDGFGQLRVLDQVAHYQGLDGDQPEALDQQVDLLPNEVLPAVADALMDTCDHFVAFASLFAAPGLLIASAQCPGKGSFLFPEKAGIVDVGAIREISERGQPDIDPDLFLGRAKRDRLDLLAADAHKPLARRVAFDDGGLRCALDGPVHDHLDMADLGEDELPLVVAFMHQGKTAVFARGGILGESQAMVARAGLETRIANLLAGFASAKKAWKARSTRLTTFCKTWASSGHTSLHAGSSAH